MLISELSKRSGLSIHTIRFYEKSGLIKGGRDEKIISNNYLQYDEEAVERLEFISDAKSVGFTIKEIGQIIDAWYNDVYTKKQKINILENQLALLDEKLKEVRQMKKKISDFILDVKQDNCRK